MVKTGVIVNCDVGLGRTDGTGVSIGVDVAVVVGRMEGVGGVVGSGVVGVGMVGLGIGEVETVGVGPVGETEGSVNWLPSASTVNDLLMVCFIPEISRV